MKKIFIPLFVLSLGLNLYYIGGDEVALDEFDSVEPLERTQVKEMKDSIKLAQSGIKKADPQKSDSCICANSKTPITKLKSDSSIDVASGDRDKEETKEIEKQISESKKLWKEESQKFFVDVLKLSSEQIEKFSVLKENRAKEIDEYIMPKVKKLQEESGNENAMYFHTSEDSIFYGDIAKKYNKLLQDNFGEQEYKEYRAFLDQFNQEQASRSKFFFPNEF